MKLKNFIASVSLGLLLISSGIAKAQGSSTGISTSLNLDTLSFIPGTVVNATITMKNSLPPYPPLTVYATATWEDWNGTSFSGSSDSIIIQPVQPLKIQAITATIPDFMELIPNTTKIDGVGAGAGQLGNVVSIYTTGISITEGQSVTATAQFKVNTIPYPVVTISSPQPTPILPPPVSRY